VLHQLAAAEGVGGLAGLGVYAVLAMRSTGVCSMCSSVLFGCGSCCDILLWLMRLLDWSLRSSYQLLSLPPDAGFYVSLIGGSP
jgi:hypothetical protein